MSWRRLQFFFFASALFVGGLSAGPVAGQIYSVALVDVDQNKFATADGHVTILVATSSADVDKARSVGDRIPDFCLANPTYRMITIVRFDKKYHAPMRGIINAIVRRRLDREAQPLQQRYQTKNISRNARKDVFAVTDFDGGIASQLGLPAGSNAFQVLVLGRKGELLRHWTEVPRAEELATVLKQGG